MSTKIKLKYSNSIKNVTNYLLQKDNTIILGQGVKDHIKLWGTLSDIPKKYQNKILDVPLSEDSIAGICLGLSLNKFYPINTHIRADFSLLMFNQLINMGAKYKYMFGGLFSTPCIFRLVVGRSWGQGAQHSQSFQSMLGHVPGIRVFMPATSQDVADCYKFAYYHCECPVVIFEHRLLYDLEFYYTDNFNIFNPTPIEVEGNDITIVATSVLVIESIRASNYFKKFNISVEVINLRDITFPCEETILSSVKKTKLLLVADISWEKYGVGSEIISLVAKKALSLLIAPPKTLGMPFAPCPTAKSLEDVYHPSYYDIVKSVKELLLNKNIGKDILMPKQEASTDTFKHFKGPF